MKIRERIYFLMPAVFLSLYAFAQTGGPIITAVPFLLITPDAHARGMGEAGAATAPGPNSIFWNTSKLVFAKKKSGIEASYLPWLRTLVPNVSLSHVSLYMKPDSISAFTVSARYFSLGEITISGPAGAIGQYQPYEYAIDAGYARRIAKRWSVGMNWKFIRSDLSGGLVVAGPQTFPGQAFAIDLSTYYYDRDRIKILGHPCTMMVGASLSNAGGKIKYADTASGDFLPANLRIGQGFEMNCGANKIAFTYQANKLLVPTPPVYALDANGNPIKTSPGHYQVVAGKDPNVPVIKGMLQSFSDAPGGAEEEFDEINFQFGTEYCYNNSFFVRAGYFYEAREKGYRQFVSLGAGVRYNFTQLDFAYMLPANDQRSPLETTLHFSLLFEFDHFKKRGK